jgi:hypothetical protein
MVPWNRCDVCGKFISYKDLDDGLAVRHMKTPDTHFTAETWETLCRRCNKIFKEVYCHPCSKAGGANMPLYHLPPVCKEKEVGQCPT